MRVPGPRTPLWAGGLALAAGLLLSWENPPPWGRRHTREFSAPGVPAGGVLHQTASTRGAALFSGKGHCTVCHSLDGSESGRGPDLLGIGERAAAQAAAFGVDGENPGLRYLVRSIVHPAEEVAADYNPMPESWLPAGLTDNEIRDLIVYLMSLGGPSLAAGEVELSASWQAAKREGYARELELFSFGNPERGATIFKDEKGAAGCIRCHVMDGEGETICPDLTSVTHVQRPTYVLESILDSSKLIVHGYLQLMILDDSGILHVGLPTEEDDEVIVLVIDDLGTTEEVWKDEIEERLFSKVSRMPGNFAEILSAVQVMDLVAYILRHEELSAREETAADILKSTSPLSAPALEVFEPQNYDQELYRLAMSNGNPATGRRIYAHYCTMCHGLDGTGTGFNAVNLETKPANHTDDKRMAKTEDRLLHGVVSRGGMKTGRSHLMPPWGGTLDQREIWDLVAYLRTLHGTVR